MTATRDAVGLRQREHIARGCAVVVLAVGAATLQTLLSFLPSAAMLHLDGLVAQRRAILGRSAGLQEGVG